MNKKNIILLVVLLLLLGGAYYLVSRPETSSTLNSEETDFAVADTAATTKVFISTRKGYNNLLERNDKGGWTVNKKYEASPVTVGVLMQTLQRMQVKRPVSRQARNTVIRTLAAQGTKVEVYTKEGLQKTFYVGGNTSDERGSHFLMDQSESPYVLHIRGFDGFLSSRFTLQEHEWRSRKIFGSIPPGIREISLQYPDTPAFSFVVKKVKDRFAVEGLPDADSNQIKSYVAQFRSLSAEMLIPNPPQRFLDSLELVKPRAILTLTDENPALSNRLVIYPNPNDINRMVARYGKKGEHLCSIQRFNFRTVIVRKQDFERRDQ